MVQDIISWLNNNSGTAIAAATGVIAWFSYVSSRIIKWQKRFLEWEEEKDRRNRQPILVLGDEMFSRERIGYYVDFFVENVGYGPGVNIVMTILRMGETMKRFAEHINVNEPLALRPLGRGERTVVYRITLKDMTFSSPMIYDPLLHVRIAYDDIFGNRYETRYEYRQYVVTQIPKRKTPRGEEEELEKP